MANLRLHCAFCIGSICVLLSTNRCHALFFTRTNVQTHPTVARLKECREHLIRVIRATHAHPLFIRLAWHDSGTYDKSLYANWPRCGGANGSIRFRVETQRKENKGLLTAVLLLEKVKLKFPEISYADIYQMASATSIQLVGGPVVPVRYGRLDANGPEDVIPEGNLPKSGPFVNSTYTAAAHLRWAFQRMGLTDKDIVVLSGAHTIGRAFPFNSGFGKLFTKYTLFGPGIPGGISWTPNWTKFDNSYYKYVKHQTGDPNLLVLQTDAALFEDPHFRIHAEKYLQNNEVFLSDYAASHLKLSELGVRWGHTGPIRI